MKLSFSKTELLKGINIALKAVSSKTTLPILKCILIDAQEENIKLFANDMELAITTVVEGNILEKGSIALEARIFSEIARRLPEGDISIETNERMTVTIKCGKSVFSIPGQDPSEFPPVPDIEKEISVPILHIADATADAIKRDGIKKVGLLGTRFTMNQDFIKDKLVDAGLEVVLPESKDMEFVNDVIFNELCLGKVLDSSRDEFKRIIDDMKKKGAEGVILGCTEIGMLIKDEDSALPTYDTTIIHATAAADLALG